MTILDFETRLHKIIDKIKGQNFLQQTFTTILGKVQDICLHIFE